MKRAMMKWTMRRRSWTSTGISRLGVLSIVLGLALLSARPSVARQSHPLEPVDTSSPRATFSSYLTLTEETADLFQRYQETGDPGLVVEWREAIERASRCFDLSEVPPVSREERATGVHIFLWDVLWRLELPRPEEVPDAEEMAKKVAEGGPDRWSIPHTEITLVRIGEGERAGEYLFSAQTVERLEEFYLKARVLPYQRRMPIEDAPRAFEVWGGTLIPPAFTDAMPGPLKVALFGQAVWKWLAVGLLLAVYTALILLVVRWTRSTSRLVPLRGVLRKLVVPALILLLTPGLEYTLHRQINITGIAFPIVWTLVPAINYLAWAYLVWLISLTVAEAMIASPRIREGSIDAHLLRLLARVLGLVAVLSILFYGGTELGLPIYGLLAGVGIGGLAVALAAQHTLEDFLGSINLFADRPVRVGDYCLYGERSGTVEEIGARSTRIRGLDRTVTTIPNADFSKMTITNLSRRDRLLMHTTIGLRYETTPDQLRYVLAKLRELLLAHPRVSDEPARVRLVGYGASSLDLDLFAYIITRDYNEFLAIQEDIYLRIIDVIEEAGTGFAFPSQTLYMARDQGLDESRRDEVEDRVRSWRNETSLPFPDYSRTQVEQIRDRLDYPPVGSPGHPLTHLNSSRHEPDFSPKSEVENEKVSGIVLPPA